jgi:hypothetical protein
MFGSLSKASARKAAANKKTTSTETAANDASGNVQIDANVFNFLKISNALDTLKSEENATASLSDFLVGENTHPHKDVIEKGVVPIKYDVSRAEPIPRDVIYDFWRACGSMLLDKNIIKKIVNSSCDGSGRALHLAAIDFQRSVMEYNFGIEPDYGCNQMGLAASNYPDDSELQDGAAGFMRIAMHSFIEQLKIRAGK